MMTWTDEEIANLHDMLLSNDSSNQLLAIELIKSKGNAKPFEAVLFFLEAYEGDYSLVQEFQVLIETLPADVIDYWQHKLKIVPNIWSSNRREFLASLEEFKTIIPIFDNFFRKAPRHTWFYHEIGKHLAGDLKKKTAGLEFLKKAVEMNPESYEMNFDYAYYLPEQKRYADEMIKHYQKCIEIGARGFEPYHNLGRVYATLKKMPQKGIEIFNQGLARFPGSVDTMVEMAYTLDEMEEYDKARALLEEAIVLDDSYHLAHNNFAFILWNAYKDYEKARVHIEKALELAPREGLYWHTLAEVEWYGYQDKTKALAALRKAKEDKRYKGADAMLKELENL